MADPATGIGTPISERAPRGRPLAGGPGPGSNRGFRRRPGRGRGSDRPGHGDPFGDVDDRRRAFPMTCKPITAALVLTLGSVLASAPAARADEKDDEAKAIARKVTTAGAALFDARDAKGLALTYTDDARLEIYSKDSAG